MEIKICTKCKQEKLLDNFCKDNSRKTGYNSWCKKCIKKQKRCYVKNNLDKINEYQRIYRKNNREKIIEQRKRYKGKYPEKIKAGIELRKLVRNNKIIKPKRCCKCKKEIDKKFLQGHHKDYNKPLEVIWLCPSCHKKYHKNEENKKTN